MWQNVYREMSKKSLLNISCRQVLSLNMRRTERVFDDVELLETLVLLIIQPLKVFFERWPPSPTYRVSKKKVWFAFKCPKHPLWEPQFFQPFFSQKLDVLFLFWMLKGNFLNVPKPYFCLWSIFRGSPFLGHPSPGDIFWWRRFLIMNSALRHPGTVWWADVSYV